MADPKERLVTIWIDADGAPGAVKEMVFKASTRTKVPVMVVANRWQQTPKFTWIRSIVVEGGLDVADDYIAAVPSKATDGP